jgi:hypothetical protein
VGVRERKAAGHRIYFPATLTHPPPLAHTPTCSHMRSPTRTLCLLQHEAVATLASSVLEQWLRSAVGQTQVLCHPRYVQDPRQALEAM